MSPAPGPTTLWFVRHGESAGNVARDEAEAKRLPVIELATRDMDVPLSPLGEQQADGLARWFAALDAGARPTAILSSPYVRARSTAARVGAALGHPPTFVVDERLRERDFGAFDGMTRYGIREKYPEEAAALTATGKFYYRPPGGESWCDVILRVRSVVETLKRDYAGERVLVVAHQVTVKCARYVLENMDEATTLAMDRADDIANCSVTSYEADPDPERFRCALRLFNFVAPLEAEGTKITRAPDVPAEPKS